MGMINTTKIINNILGCKPKKRNVRQYSIDKEKLDKDLKYIKTRDEKLKDFKIDYIFVKKVPHSWNKIMRIGSIVTLKTYHANIYGINYAHNLEVIGSVVDNMYPNGFLVGINEEGEVLPFGVDSDYKPEPNENFEIVKY